MVMCIAVTSITLIIKIAPALRIYKHNHMQMRTVDVDVAVGVAW